jgi:hypothetical protein
MAFTESEESARIAEAEMHKRSLGEGCGVKEKFSMWFALVLAVLLGIQGVRCVLLALDEPRTAWKSVCFAGAAICAFVAYACGESSIDTQIPKSRRLTPRPAFRPSLPALRKRIVGSKVVVLLAGKFRPKPMTERQV